MPAAKDDLLASWTVGKHVAEGLDGETLTFPTYRASRRASTG